MRALLGLILAAVLGSTACAQTTYPDPCPPLPPAFAAKQQSSDAQSSKNPGVQVRDAKAYCKREPQALLCAGGRGDVLTLAQVRRVDGVLRARFHYRGDYAHYGVEDHWVSGTLCGDCEDYALSAADLLYGVGEGGAHMALMVWQPYLGAGHATLLVETQDAGVVEISVGQGGEPQPMNWSSGSRIAYMRFDGKQQWTVLKPQFFEK